MTYSFPSHHNNPHTTEDQKRLGYKFLSTGPPKRFASGEEVQMEQEKRNPILSFDLQIRLCGAVYEIDLTRALKWLSVFFVAGIRLYHSWHVGAS